jgi:myosin heavy subunit
MAGNNLNIIAGLKLELTKENLKTQLDTIKKQIEKNLQIDINLKIKGVDAVQSQMKKAMSGDATKQATQALGRYETELNKVIHAYKMKQTADVQFLKTAERMRNSYKFQELSWQKQEQLINLVAKAEKNYQSVADKTRQINQNKLQQEQKLADQIANGREKASEKRRLMEERELRNAQKIEQQRIANEQKAENQIISQREKAEQKAKQVADRYEQMWQKALKNRELQEQKLTEKIIQQEQKRIRQLNNLSQSSSVRIYDPLQTQSVQSGMTGRLQSLQNTFNTMQSSKNFSNIVDPQKLQMINSQFQTLQQTIGNISNNRLSQQWNTQFSNLKNTIGGVKNELSNLTQSGYSFGEMLTTGIKKMAVWAFTATLLYQPFRQLQEGIQYIKELDGALNQIRIVTGQTQEQVADLAQSYNELAKVMNVTTKEIAKVSVDLYRQGLSGQELEERMQGIIKYSKVAGIDMGTSNKIITATMNALGISAQRTIDVMSYLGKYCPAI